MVRVLGHVGVVFVVLTATVVGGCATANSPYTARSATRFSDSRTVVVRNNSWNRVTVYVTRGAGEMIRLGDVEAMQNTVFPLPRLFDDGSGTRLMARPLAGRPFQSESFLFPIGSRATWSIENNETLSHVFVR